MHSSAFTPGLFAGQVVVVTGGGSGIGRCTAHELARLGARAVPVGRNTENLQVVQREIQQDGGQASWRSCDVRQEDGVVALVRSVVAAQGRIDGLVNNAGGPFMAPQGGSVVNIVADTCRRPRRGAHREDRAMGLHGRPRSGLPLGEAARSSRAPS